MNETETNTQKPEKSILARGAFYILIPWIPLSFLAFKLNLRYLAFGCQTAWLLACLISPILAIIALVIIRQSKGSVCGEGYAILGIAIPVIFIIHYAIIYPDRSSRSLAIRLVCGSNMKGLHSAMTVYAHDNNDVYPTPDAWCDLLIMHRKATPNNFLCKGSDAIEGQSSYAMNPNCQPSSPNDIVLLFETKADWNQSGGPELLTTENHKAKGCNVVFKNGTAKFIRTEELETLKWKNTDR